jgi:ethanolamine utilization protein EutA
METIIYGKEIIYKNPIEFTPLLDEVTIDFSKVKEIVAKAIKSSGIEKNKISTGAVIITGETARKENAAEVSNSLSEFLGDFVVATAGPKLESLLAGFGSGVCDISKELNTRIINLDIGGGTTNAAIFNCGECEETFALDIGGRLIKFDDEWKVIYISKRIEFLIKKFNLDIEIGKPANIEDIETLCKKLACSLLEVCSLKEMREDTEELFITEGFAGIKADYISFSGGIGEYIGDINVELSLEEAMKHKDIGLVLGNCISTEFKKYKKLVISPKEKIRATVIGAGNHSMTISSSTIAFDKYVLPLKNIPILKPFYKEEKLNEIYAQGIKKISMYEETPIAISLIGPKSPSYEDLKIIGYQIMKLYEEIDGPIIVILENDFGKALGQVISLNLREKREVICIDKVSTKNGNYIDIGLPIGNAIPVVIKTLIYNC